MNATQLMCQTSWSGGNGRHIGISEFDSNYSEHSSIYSESGADAKRVSAPARNISDAEVQSFMKGVGEDALHPVRKAAGIGATLSPRHSSRSTPNLVTSITPCHPAGARKHPSPHAKSRMSHANPCIIRSKSSETCNQLVNCQINASDNGDSSVSVGDNSAHHSGISCTISPHLLSCPGTTAQGGGRLSGSSGRCSPGIAQPVFPRSANGEAYSSESAPQTKRGNGKDFIGMRLAHSSAEAACSERAEEIYSHRDAVSYHIPLVANPARNRDRRSTARDVEPTFSDIPLEGSPLFERSVGDYSMSMLQFASPTHKPGVDSRRNIRRFSLSPSPDVDSDASCALDEFLQGTGQATLDADGNPGHLVLPNVEDGLSSASEADSPEGSPAVTSGPRQHRRPQASSSNRTRNTSDSLIDSSLMRAITNDIRDIKRAIVENADLPPVLARRSAQHQHHPQCPVAAAAQYLHIQQEGSRAKVEPEQQQPPAPAFLLSPTNSSSVPAAVFCGPASPVDSTSSQGQDLNTNLQQANTDPVWIKRQEPINATNSDNQGNANYESDEDTEKLLQKQYKTEGQVDIPELKEEQQLQTERKRRGREVAVRHPEQPSVLIEGVLFRARYLGSTQLVTEGQPTKAARMMQAQEAVGRIKAPDGETQPSVPVDLFVSMEKIMVLNTNLEEIMMDHALRTISYIADIGDILVLMARRRPLPFPAGGGSPQCDDDTVQHQEEDTTSDAQSQTRGRQGRIICHVFESDEAQLIAQSIGHAFQVAYLEFLKANGVEDPHLLGEMDYQEVLEQQEICGEELNIFSDKDMHKEVIVPKQRNEPLGVVIVESGWGSLLPTVVLANMHPTGPASRCGQLNIGNQIIAINGHSLVGLPLTACQQQIKSCRGQTAVKLTVVCCPPVVEVLIKRPDVKYQLGFSVQHGVICSLLRGGIAERGGIRVGHRIIEINGQSVVAVAHEKIVHMLATAVGEIHLRTMPTSIFRLLTGQETPHYI